MLKVAPAPGAAEKESMEKKTKHGKRKNGVLLKAYEKNEVKKLLIIGCTKAWGNILWEWCYTVQ